jgi:hypothetical protein
LHISHILLLRSTDRKIVEPFSKYKFKSVFDCCVKQCNILIYTYITYKLTVSATKYDANESRLPRKKSTAIQVGIAVTANGPTDKRALLMYKSSSPQMPR